MAPQREWFEKDYYKVLGVSDTATAKEIKSAYRKLSRQNHPDAHPDDKGAEDRFKEISAAYDVIGEAAKRKEYDEVRKLGPMAGGFGAPGGGSGPGGFSFSTDDLGDLGDLFGNIFGRGRRGGRNADPRGAGPQRGQDLETELQLSFDGAAQGVTTTVNLTSEAACHTCHGSGAKPGTAPRQCPRCGGRGVLDDNQGFFSLSTPCTQCRGTGSVVDEPCPTCGGSGHEMKARQVKVRIPAGVTDGQRIRLSGRGSPGRNGGPSGDLYVVVHVAEHPLFGRKGRHLTISVPITYPEAALGAEIKVPTLDGAAVTIKVPPGTRSGRTFRVKGKGVPADGGKPAGDLLVTVEVAVPAKMSNSERKAVEALAAAATESPRDHLGV
ncbi:MAG: molecular chaperone DnaJ [Acidimicrobiaceae bacterium]|jgi:molecular chaperone DnaJ